MEKHQLTAELRTDLGKSASKHYREKGLVPGVVYGAKKEPLPILLNRIELEKAFRSDYGRNVLIDLTIKSDKKEVKEEVITYVLERNAINQFIDHVDFKRIEKGQQIGITVRFSLEGVAPGVKRGGILVRKKDRIKILTTSDEIPKVIVVDISRLGVGDCLRIKDLKLSSNASFVADPMDIVVKVQRTKNSAVGGADDFDEETDESADAAVAEGSSDAEA